ncbi:MAG TPA: hypothetical protein VEL07_22065 [Planctomycetota bacterium]|nr:hypothetical protein [Planctomycetota bacterium]
MRHTLALVLLAAVATAADVPPQYRPLHDQLAARLARFEGAIASRWDGRRHDVAFSAELLSANGHRALALLPAAEFEGMKLELVRLRGLGATAVSLSVPFPILHRPFYDWLRAQPGSPLEADRDHHAEMVARYRAVIAAARAIGFAKVVAETGGLFTIPGIGDADLRLADYYRTLGGGRYAAGRAEMSAVIARELAPDWLTICTEPDTELDQTGHDVGSTPTEYRRFIRYAAGLIRAARPVRVCAGIGTWHPRWREMGDACLAAGVDVLDIHIYPINHDFLDRALILAARARASGRGAGVSEAWLFKAADTELADPAASVAIFARDAFSFWGGLDARFLRDLVAFSHWQRLEFCSPFWSQRFWAGVDHEAWMDLPENAMRVMDISGAAAAQALIAGETTEAGRAYGAYVSGR